MSRFQSAQSRRCGHKDVSVDHHAIAGAWGQIGAAGSQRVEQCNNKSRSGQELVRISFQLTAANSRKSFSEAGGGLWVGGGGGRGGGGDSKSQVDEDPAMAGNYTEQDTVVRVQLPQPRVSYCMARFRKRVIIEPLESVESLHIARVSDFTRQAPSREAGELWGSMRQHYLLLLGMVVAMWGTHYCHPSSQ